MDRSAGGVALELREVEGLGDHALGDDRGVAVDEQGHDAPALGVAADPLLAAGAPFDDGVDVERRTADQERHARTILVVDDSITTRTLEKSILEAQGYQVVLSVDGIDALNVLRSGEVMIDLVIADVEMPRMDGFNLLQAIKTDPRLSALPVILMTSRADPEDVRKGLDLGASAYITKQKFDQRELLATIGQVGNLDHQNIRIGKAGRKRWMGRRPEVRGSVMNPRDHPHGGGEGRAPRGMATPKTKWGKPARGVRTRHNPRTSRYIVRRRKP